MSKSDKQMSVEKHAPFKIGLWDVDPESLALKKGEQEETLRFKAMSLLLSLADRAGEVVSREDLIRTVWPETAATDDTLNSTIAQLRKVLVADEQVPKYIATVPKKGYRLLVPVQYIERVNQDFYDQSNQGIPTVGANKPYVFRSSVGVIALLMVALVWNVLIGSDDVHKDIVHKDIVRYDATLVASQREAEVFPKLSRDNERVVFVRADVDTREGQVVVKELASGDERILNDAPGLFGNPSWSPDDSRIAYLVFEGLYCKLKIVGSHGGPSRYVAPCSPALFGEARTSLDWLPSGDMLIVPQYVKGRVETALFMVNATTGASFQFSFPPEGVKGDANQSVSPDGSKVAFTRTSATGDDRVGIIDIVSGEERLFDHSLSVVRGLDWVDYNELMIISDRSGRAESWGMNIERGDLRWLGVGGHDIAHIDYDSINKTLVVSEIEADHNIVLRSLSGERSASAIQRFASTKDEKIVTLSHDTQQLIYVRELGNRTELWLSAIGSDFEASQTRLLNLKGRYINSVEWSPSDQALVLEILKGGVASTYIYEFDNAQFYRINSPEGENTFSPVWGGDDKTVFYTRPVNGEWHIWRYTLTEDENTPTRLTDQGGHRLQFDSVGSRILFSRHSELGIWSLPVSGEASVQKNLVSKHLVQKNPVSENLAPEKLKLAHDVLFRHWHYSDGVLYYTPLSPIFSKTIYTQTEVSPVPKVFFTSSHPFQQFEVQGDVLASSEIEQCSGDVYFYTQRDEG